MVLYVFPEPREWTFELAYRFMLHSQGHLRPNAEMVKVVKVMRLFHWAFVTMYQNDAIEFQMSPSKRG